MELPILKCVMLLALSIAAYANPTKIDQKLFADICSKAILPNRCAFDLRMLTNNTKYSSLQEVGVAFLGRPIRRAEANMNLFNEYVKKDFIAKKFYLKAKYEICAEKYKLAMDKLIEARALMKAGKFAEARDNLEDVSKVPTYCENLVRSNTELVSAYEWADHYFDVALVIGRALERSTRKSNTPSMPF